MLASPEASDFCYWSTSLATSWLFSGNFSLGRVVIGGVDGGTFVLEVDVINFHSYVDEFKDPISATKEHIKKIVFRLMVA